ncbi:hypothetical protein EDC01DRAFT_634146 [Geopyxis carbonaria]|nr:hypothetical protein EDC01DRAFT_634146 [Geopyxis carbonaria]
MSHRRASEDPSSWASVSKPPWKSGIYPQGKYSRSKYRPSMCNYRSSRLIYSEEDLPMSLRIGTGPVGPPATRRHLPRYQWAPAQNETEQASAQPASQTIKRPENDTYIAAASPLNHKNFEFIMQQARMGDLPAGTQEEQTTECKQRPHDAPYSSFASAPITGYNERYPSPSRGNIYNIPDELSHEQIHKTARLRASGPYPAFPVTSTPRAVSANGQYEDPESGKPALRRGM